MTKNNIRLTILIPSIPERFAKATALYNRMLELSNGMDVEIVMLTDNRILSIGAKQNHLLQMVNGKYFTIIHDDDEITDLKDIYEATIKDVDVITYKARCFNSDGSEYIVTQRLGAEVEHNTKDGKYLDCKRPPFPNCAWAKKFTHFRFPDISYSEDWEWVKQCLAEAKTEHHIDKVLFHYNFMPSETAASTASNSHWTNPNHIKKRCVVNLSTEKYRSGQERLVKSINGYDILTYRSESEVGAPLHKENNYAFKVYSIIKAINEGYSQILWLDASIRAIKDITPIFDCIDKDGYFFQDSGWPNSRWTTDKAKEYFGHNDGQMLSSGVLGLDITHSLAYKFFDLWSTSMLDGMFNGNWDNYRHDQTCASLIAHNLGMKLQDGNTFFVYGKDDETTISDKTVLLADGIC